MTRLDIELIKRKFFETRSQAQNEIKNGIVYVNGKKITKNSYEIKEDDIIEIKGETLKYVSKGGLKLEKALKEFNINLTNKIMLDIGSSTGGFTDCALQNNAKEVVCLIKPQFECGKEVADKYKGIILNKEIHKNIIEKIIDSFNEINYYINGLTFSPVKVEMVTLNIQLTLQKQK